MFLRAILTTCLDMCSTEICHMSSAVQFAWPGNLGARALGWGPWQISELVINWTTHDKFPTRSPPWPISQQGTNCQRMAHGKHIKACQLVCLSAPNGGACGKLESSKHCDKLGSSKQCDKLGSSKHCGKLKSAKHCGKLDS